MAQKVRKNQPCILGTRIPSTVANTSTFSVASSSTRIFLISFAVQLQRREKKKGEKCKEGSSNACYHQHHNPLCTFNFPQRRPQRVQRNHPEGPASYAEGQRRVGAVLSLIISNMSGTCTVQLHAKGETYGVHLRPSPMRWPPEPLAGCRASRRQAAGLCGTGSRRENGT